MDHVGPLCRSVEDAAIVYEVLRARAGTYAEQRHRSARAARHARRRAARLLHGAARPAGGVGVRRGVRTPARRGRRARGRRHPARAAISPPSTCTSCSPRRPRITRRRSRAGPTTTRRTCGCGWRWGATSWRRTTCARCAGATCCDEVDAALAAATRCCCRRSPCPRRRLGAATVRVGGSEEPVRNITLRLTQLFNVTGHPAITLPCGKTTSMGLPIGAQLVGTRTPGAARAPPARSSPTSAPGT